MKIIPRMMLFVLVAGLSIGPALIGCDDSKNDNNALTALLLLNSYKPDKIYIFDGGSHDGNLGSRKAANNICKTAAAGFTALAGKKYVKAFISFSATDQIKDLVSAKYGTLPVYGLVAAGTEIMLENTWDGLWGSNILNTMHDATGINNIWWSGSDTDGTYIDDATACNGWTSSSSAPAAVGGAGIYNNNTDTTWLYFGNSGCDSSLNLMCIAY